MKEIYEKYKNPNDGILYIIYTSDLNVTGDVVEMDHSAPEEIRESIKLRKKYPNTVPIIIQKYPKSSLKDLEKTKHLIAKDLTVSQFLLFLRRKLKMDKHSSLFILVSGKYSISGDKSLLDVYEKYKDLQDGILHFTYTSELTWG